MKGWARAVVPVLVAAVLGVRFFLWRRAKSRRGVGETREVSKGIRAEWLTALTARNEAFLVASREIRERFRGKLFRVATLLLLGVVAAAIVIPVLTKSPTKTETVGVVGSISVANRASIDSAARSAGVTYRVVSEPSLAAAKAGLSSGRLFLVVEGSSPPATGASRLLVNDAIAPGDASAPAEFVRALSRDVGIDAAIAEAGMTAAQVSALAGAKPVPVSALVPSTSKNSAGKAAGGTAVIGEILLFVMLSQYCGWTLVGVLEEKSSRVVEVLLSTVRPLQLLAGKLLGIGTLALAQSGLVVVFAVVLGKAVGSDFLKGTSPSALWASLLWLILGYAFYSWLYAAVGSMAERQDQVQSLAIPLSVPMILGYILALTLAGTGNASVFVQVLAYVPPTAPFIMPVLVAVHGASWWEFGLSAVICVLGTLVMARAAAQVYSRAVLRTGRRVHLRELFGTVA